MSIGLSKEEIIDMLTALNSNNGEGISAEILKEAIANIIVKNNDKIERQITSKIKTGTEKAINEHMEKLVKKIGLPRPRL